MRPVHVKGFGQHRIVLAPLTQNDFGDIQFILIAKDAGIGAILHQSQRITHDQLIGRQTAITLACSRLRDYSAHGAHVPAIRHELELNRQCDEFLQRQIRTCRYA